MHPVAAVLSVGVSAQQQQEPRAALALAKHANSLSIPGVREVCGLVLLGPDGDGGQRAAGNEEYELDPLQKHKHTQTAWFCTDFYLHRLIKHLLMEKWR